MLPKILSPGRFTTKSIWWWLVTFILFAIALRWGSFFISVINHDESTYIVIANEIMRGEVYLRDVIDTKPIGIFWLYAALIKVTGGSVAMLRLAAALAVGVGSWGLYLANRRALTSTPAGVAAGFSYAILCSVFGYYGLSPNTEIFFNSITIAAVGLCVASSVAPGRLLSYWRVGVGGILLGLAFSIKPFAAAEAVAIGLFLLYFHAIRQRYAAAILSGLTLLAGFALPILFVIGYYSQLTLLDTLAFYTFKVNAAYPIDLPWYLRAKYMGDYLLRFSPFVILAVAAVYHFAAKNVTGGAGARVPGPEVKSHVNRTWIFYLLLQCTLVTAVVLATGKRFGHYQVQLHPVLALLAGSWWATGRSLFAHGVTKVIHAYTPTLLLAFACLTGGLHYNRYRNKPDEPAQIATYLRDKLLPGDTFFTVNGRQMSYYLLNRNVPTPYVHSSLLFFDHHVQAFQIDETREARRIVENPKVTYLVSVAGDESLTSPMCQSIFPYFEPQDTIDNRLVFWARK